MGGTALTRRPRSLRSEPAHSTGSPPDSVPREHHRADGRRVNIPGITAMIRHPWSVATLETVAQTNLPLAVGFALLWDDRELAAWLRANAPASELVTYSGLRLGRS
jgi:hypothetical protein